MNLTDEIQVIMNERFGHDTLLSVATVGNGIPYVRTVNSYYENGSFYIITYALSNKMKQIKNFLMLLCVASGFPVMALARIWDIF